MFEFEDVARTYSAVFAPQFFVLVCALLAVGMDWRGRGPGDRSLAGFAARVGVLAGGWVVAFALFRGLPVLVANPPAWASDAAGSVGLTAGLLCVWAVWRRREWGDVVPGFAAVLVAATVPHLLLTPVWDVSSHVLYAATPAGYLTWVDRRLAPTTIVPIGMVPARPLADAHTWLQSVVGLLLAALVLGLVLRSRPAATRPSTGDRP